MWNDQEKNLVRCSDCKVKSAAAETLNPHELDVLTRNCAELTLASGEYVIRQGTLSSHIAYIKKGLVKVHMTGPSGKDQILKISRPGVYIGIQTVLFDKVHRYSATALTESVLCYIDIDFFRSLIQKNPGFANEIIRFLCTDELAYFERFANQLQKQLNGRLADALLYFSEMSEDPLTIELPVTKTDLAGLIGVSRESVSRALRELADTGVIRMNGRQIGILNMELLGKISKKG
ncbi:MAG: Crp/Fnr family transcriptional regulator [Bacteroidales bacterium]